MTALLQSAMAVVDSMEDTQQTKENYTRLLQIVNDEFEGDRKDKILKMYTELRVSICTSPASSKAHYHNAYRGGYLAHILNVYDIAQLQTRVFKKVGGVMDFTKAELAFAVLHHDLGKLGWLSPLYVPQTSDWHRKNLGQSYVCSDDSQYLTINDTTFLWLNKYGIEYSAKEMLGIKLADGNYDEGNKKYLMNNEPFAMRTALPYIVHWADHMATIVEKGAVLDAVMILNGGIE